MRKAQLLRQEDIGRHFGKLREEPVSTRIVCFQRSDKKEEIHWILLHLKNAEESSLFCVFLHYFI